MKNKTFDVITFGNAIVDIINPTEYDFLKKNSLVPGSMNLVSQDEAKNLLLQCEPKEIISGGSAANTAVGIASFGGNPAFIGKVKNDKFGKIFADSLNSSGVTFKSLKSSEGPPTATSLISVTPDGERTMCTYLGACLELAEHDIDEKIIIDSKICYVEGYLWDPPEAKKALRKAINICKKNNILVAFTLSDSFCVNRFRGEFIELIKNDIDILFCNEDEIKALYNSKDINNSIINVIKYCKILVVTKGNKGSEIISKDNNYILPAIEVNKVIDKNGAGDAFAAGFLFGLSNDYEIKKCGHLGNIAATEMITHYGARPQKKFSELLIDYKIKL
ncbi:MAG: adenosine kinase [Rhodospirillaceae bacterium]|nr:adenosine kinase [Rhodospirillaceae bacterium]|tara:strand:- start:3602 stop:4600 length:999 start_codon:yes stop_codon:yes gene_type:complete